MNYLQKQKYFLLGMAWVFSIWANYEVTMSNIKFSDLNIFLRFATVFLYSSHVIIVCGIIHEWSEFYKKHENDEE